MESVRFLPQYFKDHGYKTIGIGKIFHNHAPKESSRFPEEGLLVLVHARINQLSGVIKELQQMGALSRTRFLDVRLSLCLLGQKAASRKHDRPFFMAVGFIRPHVPWHAPKKWFDLYQSDQVTLPHIYQMILTICQKLQRDCIQRNDAHH